VVSELELKGGARIITNGTTFRVVADRIVSEEGAIESFTDGSARSLPDETAKAGGVVIINATTMSGNLRVRLPGQDGAPGMQGRNGAPGAAGASGQNAADHLFDCARGGGDGRPGGRGGDGEPGGVGGAMAAPVEI